MKNPARNSVRGIPFKSVDSRRGPGGARPGSGRPPEKLKQMCRSIVDKYKLVQKLGKIANGQNVDRVVTDIGKVIKVPASVNNQISATTELLDRGYGKPNQIIEVQTSYAMSIVAEVMKVLRLIPTTCPHCKTKSNLRQDTARLLLDLSKKFDAQEAAQ